MKSYMQVDETRTHPHTMHQNKLKMLKDLNICQHTIQLLDENISKRFSDINLMNIFSGQSPKATEIKAKINQWDLIKLTSFCRQRKPKENKKTTYRMGENSFK